MHARIGKLSLYQRKIPLVFYVFLYTLRTGGIFLKLIYTILLIFLLCTPCYAADSAYQLMINARLQEIQVREQNGAVYLPIQDTVLLFQRSWQVYPNVQDRALLLIKEGQYSYFAEGHPYGIVDNQLISMEASPFWEEGTLWLSAPACAKLTGCYYLKSKSYLQFVKWS